MILFTLSDISACTISSVLQSCVLWSVLLDPRWYFPCKCVTSTEFCLSMNLCISALFPFAFCPLLYIPTSQTFGVGLVTFPVVSLPPNSTDTSAPIQMLPPFFYFCLYLELCFTNMCLNLDKGGDHTVILSITLSFSSSADLLLLSFALISGRIFYSLFFTGVSLISGNSISPHVL